MGSKKRAIEGFGRLRVYVYLNPNDAKGQSNIIEGLQAETFSGYGFIQGLYIGLHIYLETCPFGKTVPKDVLYLGVAQWPCTQESALFFVLSVSGNRVNP